jgi:uncharacterized protein YebE (UPF0316 family)
MKNTERGNMSLLATIIFIFVFRLLDVMLETARTILVVNKFKWLPAIVAFFEVFIWCYVFSEVIMTHKHWAVYLAYAAGYSVGTLVGCRLGHYVVSKVKGK